MFSFNKLYNALIPCGYCLVMMYMREVFFVSPEIAAVTKAYNCADHTVLQ